MAKAPNKDNVNTEELQPQPEIQEASSHDVARITGNATIAVPVKQGEKRMHKATYATDKKNGGYLVRVEGPSSNMFAGKIVPVVKRDDSESAEALERLIWTGKDQESGKPVSLYTFTQKPRENAEPLF